MKIYVGIHATNHFLYIAALNNTGVAVLKSQYPLNCRANSIMDSLFSLKTAFNATLKIAIEKNDSIKPVFIQKMKKKFSDVQLFDSSLIYSTDLIPEDKFDFVIYRNSLQLAILRSLAD